jgi:hypothetical protein
MNFKTLFMSRKFLLALSIVIFSAVALALSWIPASAWVTITSIVMAAYGAANVVQKRVENGGNHD